MQEKEQEKIEAEEKLKITEKMWEKDKAGLQSCQQKCVSLQEEQNKLQMQLRATQVQLGKSKELLGLHQQKGESSVEQKPVENHADLPGNNQVDQNGHEPQTLSVDQEVCIFELLKPGSCNRGKEKCKFSHEINEHLMIDSVISEKAQQISQKLNKCVYQMVEKGSCPLQDSCSFHHKHATHNQKADSRRPFSRNNSFKKICYMELLEEGSCTRGPGNCRFSHDLSESTKADSTLISQIKQGMLIKQLCINEYREAHSCKKKEQCTFRHEIHNSERANPVIQKAMKERWETITNIKKKSAAPSLEDQLKEARNVVNSLQKILAEQRP